MNLQIFRVDNCAPENIDLYFDHTEIRCSVFINHFSLSLGVVSLRTTVVAINSVLLRLEISSVLFRLSKDCPFGELLEVKPA